MSWRNGLLLGLISAFWSSLACIIYDQIYSKAFYVEFSKVLNIKGFIISSVIACSLMTLGHYLLINWKKNKLIPWANIGYSILSFASIVSVLSFKLPLDVEAPELFLGLAIPMRFFPILSFLSIYPFFKIN